MDSKSKEEKSFFNRPVLNHIAIYVKNLNDSTFFYREIMGFEQIPEPFKDGLHSWFQISGNAQLHIIEGAEQKYNHDINGHLAFTVEDLNKFMQRLEEKNVAFRSFFGETNKAAPRPDGVLQIFLQDPDNVWIEVNNEKVQP